MLTPASQVRARNWAWSFLCPAPFLFSPCGSSLSHPTWKLFLRGWHWWGHTEFSVCCCTKSLSAAPPCSWSLSLLCWEQPVCSEHCWCWTGQSKCTSLRAAFHFLLLCDCAVALVVGKWLLCMWLILSAVPEKKILWKPLLSKTYSKPQCFCIRLFGNHSHTLVEFLLSHSK